MYTNERLNKIYNKTDGGCHICGKKLCLSNYSAKDKRGNWEVEHSKPKAVGGTDNLNNLFAACISCNRAKGKNSTKSARAQHGRTRAPHSAAKKQSIKNNNTFSGGLIGLGLTVLVTASPVGLLIGAITGGLIGSATDTDVQ